MAWHSGLTKAESKQIESIKKTAFKIILGPDYIYCEVPCTIFGVEPLELRRVQLCLKYAKKGPQETKYNFYQNPGNQSDKECTKTC